MHGIANHPSDPATVTTIDSLEQILTTPLLEVFPSQTLACTQHLFNVYCVQVTTEARVCIHKPSLLSKHFPSVDIPFWHIITDDIVTVGHMGVL